MKSIKRLIPLLVLTLFFSTIAIPGVFPQNVFARTCVHPAFGPIYSEASHPHAYYHQCSACKEKVYTGGYATKAHGTGEWGSGTCPSCGSHSFTGGTCTTRSKCVCGVESAYGSHNYANTYSDAEHPHAVYLQCNICWGRQYTGTYATKNHGTGALGSGTCPSCGTHTYDGTLYLESGHPHRYYNKCTLCLNNVFTGQQQIKEHGKVSEGKCPNCGSHNYSPGLQSLAHPHEVKYKCSCGLSYNAYPLQSICSNCTANANTASNSTSTTGILSYVDGDNGLGATIFVPITYYVEYSNLYNYPASNDIWNLYNYPSFASFYSRVTSHAEGQAPDIPEILYMSNTSVKYYDQSGNVIATQSMTINAECDAVSRPGLVFQLNTLPSYTVVSARCNVSGSPVFLSGENTTFFS